MWEVFVLFEGYSKNLDPTTMEANCSCTLLKGPKLIIVDTMTAWDKDRLIEALDRHNVKPADIDYVVCTHGHADHIGNNNLFTNAEHIVGSCVHRGNIFYEKNLRTGEYFLCEGIRIVATPGHTLEHITVFVDTRIDGKPACLAIAGDLFEKEEDIENPSIWKEVGTPEIQNMQARMRFFVINIADYIIPGHGKMFAVDDHKRNLVKNESL